MPLPLFTSVIQLLILLVVSEHYEDVTSVIFAYIDLLRSSPPSEWAFKEVAQLADLAFQFKEKSPPTGTVMSTSLSMSKPYPRDLLLSAPYKSTEWNPRVVKELLDRMTQDQCRITVASQNEIGGRTYDQKEKWYGTEYTIEPFSDNLKAVSACLQFEAVTAWLMSYFDLFSPNLQRSSKA